MITQEQIDNFKRLAREIDSKNFSWPPGTRNIAAYLLNKYFVPIENFQNDLMRDLGVPITPFVPPSIPRGSRSGQAQVRDWVVQKIKKIRGETEVLLKKLNEKNSTLPNVGGTFEREIYLKRWRVEMGALSPVMTKYNVFCARERIFLDIEPIKINNTTVDTLMIVGSGKQGFLDKIYDGQPLPPSSRVGSSVYGGDSAYGIRINGYFTLSGSSIDRRIQIKVKRVVRSAPCEGFWLPLNRPASQGGRERYSTEECSIDGKIYPIGNTNLELVGSNLFLLAYESENWSWKSQSPPGQSYAQTLNQVTQYNQAKPNSESENTPLLIGSLVLMVGYLGIKKIKQKK